MSRGDSRISHLSQFSESTVLNQDFADTAALEQDLLGRTQTQVTDGSGKIASFQVIFHFCNFR